MPPKRDREDEEGSRSLGPKISFSDLEKSMITFTGDDTYPISTWINDFEDTADIMEWSKIEKLVYAKRLLDGTARLFLRSLGSVRDWTSLKNLLIEEFGPKLNSAMIHKKLVSRKMKRDETFQQYFLNMKELALHGNIEDQALMEYVIDGIHDLETNKAILYGASDMKEFRKKLDIYSEFRKKASLKAAHPVQAAASFDQTSNRKKLRVHRCYNCGDLDHVSSNCPKGVKCFKCNVFGHKSTECTNQPLKTLNIHNKEEKEKVPYKRLKINDKDVVTLIDSGSDVNLITKSEFEKIREDVKDYKTESTCITGLAKNEVCTEGIFIASVQIDNFYTEMKFHVVKDNYIPVTAIIGNPILKDFELRFTPEGIFFQKIMHLTLQIEDKHREDYDERIHKMCEDYKPNEKKKDNNVELSDFTSPVVLTKKKDVVLTKTKDEVLTKKKGLPPRLARSALLLEDYDYKIEHRPGARMKHANAMSRYSVYPMLTETTTRIRKTQIEDEHIRLIRKILETDDYQDYMVENKIFYKMKDGTKLVVIPKLIQYVKIRRNHEKGNLGVIKTEELIKREYVIDNLPEKIIKVIMRDKDDEIQKLIDEENSQNVMDQRQELRKNAKGSIQNIQEENIRDYKRKRKKADESSEADD